MFKHPVQAADFEASPAPKLRKPIELGFSEKRRQSADIGFMVADPVMRSMTKSMAHDALPGLLRKIIYEFRFIQGPPFTVNIVRILKISVIKNQQEITDRERQNIARFDKSELAKKRERTIRSRRPRRRLRTKRQAADLRNAAIGRFAERHDEDVGGDAVLPVKYGLPNIFDFNHMGRRTDGASARTGLNERQSFSPFVEAKFVVARY